MSHEMEATVLTFGTIGEPGNRTFLVQGRDDERQITLKLEKPQVTALADSFEETLDRLAREVGPDPVEPEPDLTLHSPVNPLFTVGTLAIGYDQQNDRVTLRCEAIEDDDDDIDHDVTAVEFLVRRPVLRHLVRHGRDLVEGGRPKCEWCGNPMDDPHTCPRTNGRHPRID